MAKAKKKAKVRDLKPRKQVKGGVKARIGRTEDPCQGGEITRR
jgi:hypothetical protein